VNFCRLIRGKYDKIMNPFYCVAAATFKCVARSEKMLKAPYWAGPWDAATSAPDGGTAKPYNPLPLSLLRALAEMPESHHLMKLVPQL